MRQLHLPALGPGMIDYRTDTRPTSWLDPRTTGTDGAYPGGLISYWHWRKTPFTFPEGHYVFGDSGGYSVATSDAVIDPRDALDWQAKHCDVGCILDVPPYFSEGATLFSGVFTGNAAANWFEAKKRTRRNVETAREVYDPAGAFRWWGVLHGETYDQMQEWHEMVTEVYPFDAPGEGWAFKPHPLNDPRAVAQALRFAKEYGITRMHLLGGTGLAGLTTLFTLGPEAGVEFASYDSGSSIARGLRRAVLIPICSQASCVKCRTTQEHPTQSQETCDRPKTRYVEVMENNRDRGETFARDYMTRCGCWSCSQMRHDMADAAAILWEDDTYIKDRMIYHNHLITVELLATLERGVQEDPEFLKEEFGGRKYYRALRAFEGTEAKTAPRGQARSIFHFLD